MKMIAEIITEIGSATIGYLLGWIILEIFLRKLAGGKEVSNDAPQAAQEKKKDEWAEAGEKYGLQVSGQANP